MKRGNIFVEQVTKDGLLVEGYDESLSPSEIFERISKYFPNVSKATADPRVIVGNYKGYKFAIRCKNVTYLGSPHPHFKKRIQIPDDLSNFYRIALSMKAEPLLMGIYSFGTNLIFVDFKIDTYIEKKAHNSSAHIYVSDLAAATEEGYFQKIDYFGNTVTAIRPDVVSVYLDELFGIEKQSDLERSVSKTSVGQQLPTISIERTVEELQAKQESRTMETVVLERPDVIEPNKERLMMYASAFKRDIVPKVKLFFTSEEKDWKGIECYQKMIAANYRNKYQPEWVGFFLEYEFEKYLKDNSLNYLITYAQDKKEGGIDLDLYFPTVGSYGDLKAHSEESRGIQGNDWNTIFDIINRQDEKSHVYYIVCEHSTEKDSLHNYEVTKFWNTAQGKANLMSYANRMKNYVRLKRVYILDINYSNREYLTKFKQGLNSNGKPREPKIMIEQDNLKYFMIDQMIL